MSSEPKGRPIAVALSVVVALVVGIGLYLVGSPATARLRALDERRVEGLRQTTYQVGAYWQAKHALPATLDSTDFVADESSAHRDPATGARYEYRATSDSTYDLCATFDFPSPDRYPGDDTWRHPAGRHCFPIRLPDSRRPAY